MMRLILLLAPLCLLALPSSARAEDDEWALSFGPAYRGLAESFGSDESAYRSAPGAFVRLRYGLGDFLQVGASLDAGVVLATDVSPVSATGAAFLELHYVVDIVTWVPFVSIGLGALARGAVPDDGLRVDVVVGLGGGLEYRPARDWAVGFTGRYELVVTDLARADAFSLALVYTVFFE